jgi:hypothetical protein
VGVRWRAALTAGAAIGVAVAASGCAAEQSDSVGAAAVFEDVAQAMEDGDPAALCDTLARRARLQVRDVGHTRLVTCESAVRPMMVGARNLSGDLRPDVDVLGVDVKTSAVAEIDVAGRTTVVPLVVEDGEWKLDGMFGLGRQP